MDTGSLNALWSAHLVEEFHQQGITHFFLAPGARCTPLTLAVARGPVTAVHHYDERGLAFAALGYARATGRPGVVITTSGTAVANLLPAIIEANQDGIPMIVCTADRPPELRDCGANQAIDQVKIFGDHVRWFCDMPCPTPEIDFGYVHTTAAQAFVMAETGPVHLNCQFRAPFDGPKPIVWPQVPQWTRVRRFPPKPTAFHVDNFPERGWILCGRQTRDLKKVQTIAAMLGWPVYGDVTSPYRMHSLDLLLGNPDFCERCMPEMVVILGRPFVSKALLQFLAQHPEIQRLRFSEHAQRENPTHQSERVVLGSFEVPFEDPEKPDNWTRQPAPFAEICYQVGSQVTQRLVEHVAAQKEAFGELMVAFTLSSCSTPEQALFIGNSLPVRLMDLVRLSGQNKVAANRGASGIDGLVASASGFAIDAGRTTLLIGDLSLLHDLNSLALAKNLIIVVINNDGGGIFHLLPIRSSEHFDEHFGTPHGMRFEGAAAQFGLQYECATNLDEFAQAYAAAMKDEAPYLIEVITDRWQTAQQLQDLREIIAQPLP